MLGPVSRVPACRQSGLCSMHPNKGAAQSGQGLPPGGLRCRGLGLGECLCSGEWWKQLWQKEVERMEQSRPPAALPSDVVFFHTCKSRLALQPSTRWNRIRWK